MYHHQNVSILFADIVGFTSLSSQISAESLVWLLNSIFLDFDNLVEKMDGVEKIKTIGDCYVLCAGFKNQFFCQHNCNNFFSPQTSGVPKQTNDHAHKLVTLGLEMIKRNMSVDAEGTVSRLQIRVGIHSGEVMAGLIGYDKLFYGFLFFYYLFFFKKTNNLINNIFILFGKNRYLGTRCNNCFNDGTYKSTLKGFFPSFLLLFFFFFFFFFFC